MFRHSLKFLALTSATLHAEPPQGCAAQASVVLDSGPIVSASIPTDLESLKPICEVSTIVATNKPPTMRIGHLKGEDTPLSCMNDGNQQSYDQQVCDKEKRQLKAYPMTFASPASLNPQQKKSLREMRNQVEEDRKKWAKEMTIKLSQFGSELSKNHHNAQKLQLLLTQLEYLKKEYIKAKASIQQKLGNCGEQSATAAIKLLQKVQKENLKFKLYLVTLHYKIDNHRFVLIKNNSDTVPSPKFSNNTVEIKQILKNLKESGFLCDRWNQGLFASFKEDKSNLFDHNSNATRLNIEQVFFDFDSLRSLRMPNIQKLICDELDKMHLANDAEATCEKSLSTRKIKP